MSKSYFEELAETDKGSQASASARLRFRALSLLHDARAKSGRTQSDLARRLGIRKSAVNQVLDSDGSMKLSTLAECRKTHPHRTPAPRPTDSSGS